MALLDASVLASRSRAGGPEMSDSLTTPDDPDAEARRRMVTDQIERRGIRDRRVLEAMRSVPRHLFVPELERERAYDDGPLSIGEGQTISQPYIVAFMSEAIDPGSGDRVLEVGTGSGYQTAILASIVDEVFSIEIRPDLAESARRRLDALGCRNVIVRVGDGHAGWPEEGPFDGILVTAAPGMVPPALIEQLAPGGRLVIPIGAGDQNLVRLTRTSHGIERETLLPVRFVPMTGATRRAD
ncbi:MAG TPA: protein-L-isoaspartate(D-aspartate) O-methyltransferase [Candidatus Polarisedimenticolia bacterium]|nr:protein-L-isoaspartate(D-aspartate) O-methyltransferase [Candidatus Polarisedimenticolia bacterium]